MLLDSFPFILTGTLRENLDPFGEHSDLQLREVLERVEFWSTIPSEEINSGIT